MRPTSLLRYALTLAFVLAGTGLASAQADRVSAEEAEALGLSSEAATHQAARGGVNVCTDDVLLVPDFGTDGVAVFDAATGDLIDALFITDPTNLGSPKHAIPNFGNDGIFVVDQIRDGVFEYDCEGNFVGLFAPAGGVNTAILDNAVALAIDPTGTRLWVAVTGGANQDAIAEFDMDGNYLGNFVANGSGGVDGPFFILKRETDVLVPAINSDDVHRYDYSGNFLGIFQDPASGLNFPEQAYEAANGNVLVAGFSSPAGAYEFDGDDGTQIGLYNVITGLRGVYELPNGNLLVTNSGGIHEITRANTLVRTISADGEQYIERFPPVGGGPTCDLDFSATVNTTTVNQGDQLVFSVTVTNTSASTVQAALRLMATGPANQNLNFGTANIPAGVTASRDFTVRVPNNAPSGTYAVTLDLDADGEDCAAQAFTIDVGVTRVGDAGATGTTAFELVDGTFASAPAVAGVVGVAPNPFVGQAAISYEVTEAAPVRLAVYDVLGREVAVLVDAQVEAGAHAAVFDARGLAAGTYVYRLQVGDDVRTGRMTLSH